MQIDEVLISHWIPLPVSHLQNIEYRIVGKLKDKFCSYCFDDFEMLVNGFRWFW